MTSRKVSLQEILYLPTDVHGNHTSKHLFETDTSDAQNPVDEG